MGAPLSILAVIMAFAASAQEAPTRADNWFNGLPIASVTLEAPRGGLPEESLDTLLRAHQGDMLSPQTLRLDLATLYGVGDYRSVDAQVESWYAYDQDGEMIPAVNVNYVVIPAPQLVSVVVTGNQQIKSRQVLERANLAIGDPFYPHLQAPRIEERLQRWIQAKGYPNANVHINATEVSSDKLAITLEVQEGLPTLVQEVEVNLRGTPDRVSVKKIKRWARRAGLRPNNPLTHDAITAATQEIRVEMAQIQEWPFRRHRGYLQAQVTGVLAVDDKGRPVVNFLVDPRSQMHLEVSGLAVFRQRVKVREALGIDQRTRFSRGFMSEADDDLVDWLQRRGHYEAQVEVNRIEDEHHWTLQVRAERGPRHVLVLALDVDGEALSRRQLRRLRRKDPARAERLARLNQELRGVMKQASEVLRRDFFTEGELAKGAYAARQRLIDQGYQDAKVSLGEVSVSTARWARRSGIDRLQRMLGGEGVKQARVDVHVDLGGRQTLTTLRLQDMAEDVDLAWDTTTLTLAEPDGRDVLDWEARRALFEGQPFSPQRLEVLRRQIVSAHQRAGYLDADARVIALRPAPLQVDATIDVDPGPRVLLRSVVLKGQRHTRSTFLRKELGLSIGQTLTSTDILDARSRLYDLNIFHMVQMDPTPRGASVRDLVVGLGERKSWGFELGGGVNTDQGIRALGRATRRNVLGRAHRIEGNALLGFNWRSGSITDWVPDFRDPDLRLSISYIAPRFPLRAQESTFDLLLRERRQERTWQMDRSGAGLSVETVLGPTLWRGGARIEARQLRTVDTGALLAGEPWRAPGYVDNVLRPSLPTRHRWQEGLNALVQVQAVDDPILPQRGVAMSLIGEWAPGLTVQRNDPVVPFLKGEGRVSVYLPLGGTNLRLSGIGGRSFAYQGGVVPLEDRFRMGGTGSMRGYVQDSVGPRNRASRLSSATMPAGVGPLIDYLLRDDPERYVPTGGDTEALGTVELQLPLSAFGFDPVSWQGYRVAIFSDIGNVWQSSEQARAATTPSELIDRVPSVRYGVGAGLRMETPVGPVAFDVASNLQAATARFSKRTLLREQYSEKPIRIHLTVGTLF